MAEGNVATVKYSLTSLAFKCPICDDYQTIEGEVDYPYFPLCDNCKRDLQDLVLERRRERTSQIVD